ncbi:MAG: AAA family ATPase, partial [Rhizobacter sp.]
MPADFSSDSPDARLDTLRFARTKIQPPRARRGQIARPRLHALLDEAVAHARLVLLSAPAGAGKTTLLGQWLAEAPPGRAHAWLALDEDDDLPRFAAALIAALEPFDLPWRTAPEALIRAAQDDPRSGRASLVAALVNALAAAEARSGVLLLDDAHRVADPAVFELLEALVERLPPGWCALVASRVDPPLGLARLRVSGELVELRQRELGFALDETEALARARLPALAAGDIQRLQERTQGWAAGLGLLMADAQIRRVSSAGDLRDRHVFDYFASEVLADMP